MMRVRLSSQFDRSSGFTLTELLVAVAIFTILGLMLVTTMQATLSYEDVAAWLNPNM